MMPQHEVPQQEAPAEGMVLKLLRANICLCHPGLDRAEAGGKCGWDEPRAGLFDLGT